MSLPKKYVNNTNCCVPQCSSKKSKCPELSFHYFPTERAVVRVKIMDTFMKINRRKEWIRLLRIGKPVSGRVQVCSRHFLDSDYIVETQTQFQRRRLKKSALPSCNLPVTPMQNEKHDPVKKAATRKIQRLNKNNFPKNNQRREQWLKAVQRENWTPSQSSKLCSKHFPEEMIDRTSVSCVRLREHAVPSIFEASSSYQNTKNIKMEKPWNAATESLISDTITESSLPNQIHIKVEEPWEESTDNTDVSGTVTGNCVSSQVKIQDVRSLLSSEIAECGFTQKENNTEENRIATNFTESMDAVLFRKPIKIDKRDEIFGQFIACELSALRENTELYLRTKQSILDILMEVNYEQMSSSSVTS